MSKKKGKSVSFDAMVKFFMNTYQIPTKRDVERLNARLDHIEKLLQTTNTVRSRRAAIPRNSGKQSVATATDAVLEVIRKSQDGIRFSDIQNKTGFSLLLYCLLLYWLLLYCL